MLLLPHVDQNYHPLLYHNYNKTCGLLVPLWIATHAHSVTDAGRIRPTEDTLTSDEEGLL